MRLETARLVLRPPAMADAEAIYRGINDWDVVRMLARPPWPYLPEHAVQWLEQMQAAPPGVHNFIVARKGDPDLAVGTVGLGPREHDDEIHLGFWLRRDLWGQGLMTEAAGEVVRYGFEELDLPRIHSGCYRDNEASRRVHARLGFAVVGENLFFCGPRGAEIPHLDFALSRADWRAAAKPGEMAV